MRFKELIKISPKFHTEKGRAISYGLSNECLLSLFKVMKSGLRTVETGAGMSTVVFALKGTDHVCVTPDKDQIDKIKEFCAGFKISLDKVKFVNEKSEDYLPTLKNEIDFALIDGRHAFPTPYIDWYYMSRLLIVNGLVMIDDTQIKAIKILKKFLEKEKEWKLVRDMFPRCCVFKKLKDGSEDKGWVEQPFNSKRLW